MGQNARFKADHRNIKGFENVYGAGSDDVIFRSGVVNTLSVGLGGDELRGFAGYDLIYGGSENDYIV